MIGVHFGGYNITAFPSRAVHVLAWQHCGTGDTKGWTIFRAFSQTQPTALRMRGKAHGLWFKGRCTHIASYRFRYDYQLIDVGDHQGKGETEPTPFFYQNLAEAEYVVAVYMYMRLLGYEETPETAPLLMCHCRYPANKISIITSYNGQKHLIRDVVQQRCVGHPLFGAPHKISTVDRFQGQQNDCTHYRNGYRQQC